MCRPTGYGSRVVTGERYVSKAGGRRAIVMIASPVSEETAVNVNQQITRRQVLKVGALGAVATGVAACAPGSASVAPSASAQSSSAATAAPASASAAAEAPLVTLRVLNQGGADTDYLGAVEAAWNAQSTAFQVKFEQSTSTSDKLDSLARTQLSGNNPPDLIWLSVGTQPAGSKDLREAGLLLDLTPYATQFKWEQRFIPDFWQQYQVDGKVWYVANSSSSWSYYYYNPELFKAAGITVPEGGVPTKEEFAGWRDKVKATGVEFIALGSKEVWPATHHLINMFRAFVPKDRLLQLQDNAFNDTGVKYTDPDALAAITRYQQTFEEGYFAPGPNAMADGEALALFTSGKAAVFQSGFWGAYVIPGAAPEGFKMGLFHWPQEDPAVPKAIYYGNGNGYCISSKTKFPDETAAILDFIISKEGQQISLSDHGLLPTVNSDTLPPAETDYPEPKDIYEAIVDAQNRFGPESSTFYISGVPEIGTPIAGPTQLLIDGTMTPQEFAEELQKLSDDYRATL